MSASLEPLRPQHSREEGKTSGSQALALGCPGAGVGAAGDCVLAPGGQAPAPRALPARAHPSPLPLSPASPRPHLAWTAAAPAVAHGHASRMHPPRRVLGRWPLPGPQAPRSALPRGGERKGRRRPRGWCWAGGQRPGEARGGGIPVLSPPRSAPHSAVGSLPAGRMGLLPGIRSTRATWRGVRGAGRREPRGYVMNGPAVSRASSLQDCPTLPSNSHPCP